VDLATLDRAPAAVAVAEFRACCGSSRWAAEMAARRPFADLDALQDEADRVWWDLAADDWRDALAAHPRIGERAAGHDRAARWSAGEQAGAAADPPAVRAELARANRDYEDRFGFVFVVCATGKTGEEMLALLRERLANDPADEVRVAAAEQAKITRLRLAKLLA